MKIVTDEGRLFLPGEPVEVSGLYTAFHERRLTNGLLLIKGQSFPRCRCCGERVRFILAAAGPHISEDKDFQANGELATTKTILCICGDRTKLLCRSLLLLHEGFKVFQAEDSVIAARLVAHCWPDCVLLDYVPGVGKTTQNAQQIKKRCSGIKVFVASSYAIPGVLRQVADAVIDVNDPSEFVLQLSSLLESDSLPSAPRHEASAPKVVGAA